LRAQQSDQAFSPTTPATPTVADLIKYVEYPTDLAFGMVDITIPLYEFREGDIVIPISISYHHGSFSASTLPGRLGWGWSLNAGPTLGRKINGAPDERHYLFDNREDKDKDHFEYCYLWEMGGRDEEPDAFYFKTLSASGKFFLTRDLRNSNAPVVPVITPYIPLKIDYNIKSGNDRSFEYFDLTDDNGFRYHFGRDNLQAQTNGVTTGWYARSVVSPVRGDSVRFTYNRNNLTFMERRQAYSSNTDFVVVEHDCTLGWNAHIAGCDNNVLLTDPKVDNDYKVTVGPLKREVYVVECTEPEYRGQLFTNYRYKELKSGCYDTYGLSPSSVFLDELPLATIEGKITRVDFYGDDKLERVVVTDKQTGRTVRRILFDQPVTKGYGLLNGVTIFGDEADAKGEKYTFTYRNTSFPTPNRRTRSGNFAGNFIDLSSWDENTSVSTFIPNRNPKTIFRYLHLPSYGQPLQGDSDAGLIKSITYPTGRVTTFTFEHNEFRFLDMASTPEYLSEPATRTGCVGWRVRELSEFDPITGKTQTKEFRYGKDEDGIGYGRYDVHKPDNWRYTKLGTSYDRFSGHGVWETTIDFHTPFIMAVTNFNEKAAVHYDYVTEYDRDPDDPARDNGKTVRRFTANPESGWTKVEGTNLSFEYSDHSGVGIPIKTSYYKRTRFGHSLSREREFEYVTLRADRIDFGKLYNQLYVYPQASNDYHTLMKEASQRLHRGYQTYRYGMSTSTRALSKEKETRFVDGVYRDADSVVINTILQILNFAYILLRIIDMH
jgi:hypothetical protein